MRFKKKATAILKDIYDVFGTTKKSNSKWFGAN